MGGRTGVGCRIGCLLALGLLAGCATPPAPVEDVPVAAGDGFVWVAKDMGGDRAALWGPRDSEAIFIVTCNAAPATIEFRHYGIAAPTAIDSLRIEAGDASAQYDATVEPSAMADALLATTPAADPFLDRMLAASQLRVIAGGEPLAIRPSPQVLRPLIEGCRGS